MFLKANNRFDLAIKNALVAAGGTGFTFPTCSAAAYSTTGTYPGGSTVSYQGFVAVHLFFQKLHQHFQQVHMASEMVRVGGTGR
jgi:hypothetical protein